MKKKKTFYCVGNAHLDPVWQWQWQEGSSEAKATIRSALDRMNEFPDYIFVCSSASIFRWIEEFAPSMFEEIRQRVAEGRFVIVGGMHVQPDCNNASGEGYARQTLYSQRYFKEKLGVTAKVGYNVDSFGHNLMLPQILQKSGMKDYIFMRPGQHEKDMDSDIFYWTSPDGSSVLTHRIADGYGFYFESLDRLDDRLKQISDTTRTDLEEGFLFHGIGNHGGGPTKMSLSVIEEYKKLHPETELIHSNVTDFFDRVRESGAPIPEHRDDLQHHAAGCYATVSSVKAGIRRGEVNLSAAENYAVLANSLLGKPYKNKVFEEAWNNICFLHFHDSMGGCSIRQVHDDSAYIFGMAHHTAAIEENNALQSISWEIDTSGNRSGLPIVVFNPHGFDVDTLVHVFLCPNSLQDEKGNDVPYQRIDSTTAECFWRTDTLFKAHVPALGYAVYYLNDDWTSREGQMAKPMDVPGSRVHAIPFTGYRTANEHRGTVLENDLVRIEFELHTGYIISYTDKRTGEELITGRAAVPVVVDEYYHDTWSHAKNFFTDRMARFSDAEVTVVENGPIRATVKVVSRYNDSYLTQYFSLEPDSEKLSVRAEIDWREKNKMLKLAWPMKVTDPKAYYEIPFGVIERPADGEEEPGLTWTAVKGSDRGFALINSDTYSSSVEGGTIYQTVLRSPIYGDHGGPRTAESEYTEQGKRKFSYELMPVGDSWAPVIREAKILNKGLSHVRETWHGGKLSPAPSCGLSVSAPNVMLSALKRSEDGSGLIIRLYETDGVNTPVTVSGKLLRVPLNTEFTPWSVRTFMLADGAEEWKEVLLTEFDM
ncbi:MAG: alpha-mannosidase [Clostridia bacterium]|nr:alpha-mannosidase [Clostridia bacterium]